MSRISRKSELSPSVTGGSKGVDMGRKLGSSVLSMLKCYENSEHLS